MNTPPVAVHLPCNPTSEKDITELTQQALHLLSPALGAFTLDSAKYGAALGLKARDQTWVRVLSTPNLERLPLPLAQGWQTTERQGEYSVGWPLTRQALCQPLPEQFLLWWSQAQGCALLVPALAWWQAGWDLWMALTQVSLSQDRLFRPQLQWHAHPPHPARWQVQAWLPSAYWLRALARHIDLDDVLLMSLRDSASAPMALLKAYSALQVLPTKALPPVKALSTTLLHASADTRAPQRAHQCGQLTPLGVALGAQCAYTAAADWQPAHQSVASTVVWQPQEQLLQNAPHGSWPAALQNIHLRTGPADGFEEWPAWSELEPALASATAPGFAPVLKSYFEKAHY